MRNLKTLAAVAALIATLGLAGHVIAADAMDHGSTGKTEHSTMDKSMDKGADQGAMAPMGFTHTETVDGIVATFQVMTLASMNMKDAHGATHHVMVEFTKDGAKLAGLKGSVKLIAPSGKEQTAQLTDYSGTLASNFTINEPGKWGVICLFKDGDAKHLAKFWYENK